MIGLLMAAGAAFAQPPLQPWAALVGHCFSGPAPVPAGIDKHCFDSVYGGQHVRDRHVVTVGGKDVYAGETIYSARGVEVIFTYWNSIGGLGTGKALVAGDEWRFSGTIHATASSAEQPMASAWKMLPTGYQVREGSGAPRLFERTD